MFLSAQTYGVYNTAPCASYALDVDNSVISSTNNTIRNDTELTTRIGASKLDGGPVTGGGTIICAGVYDEAYTFMSGPACP